MIATLRRPDPQRRPPVWPALMLAVLLTLPASTALAQQDPIDPVDAKALLPGVEVLFEQTALGAETIERINATIERSRRAKIDALNGNGALPTLPPVLQQLSQPSAASKAAAAELHKALGVDEAGRVPVRLRLLDSSPDRLSTLRAAGAEIIKVDGPFVQARVPIARLESVAATSGVASIVPMPPGLDEKVWSARQRPQAAQPGSVVTEGDAVHRADLVRDMFGIDGTGVKVCVISDGTDGFDDAVALGDLPPALDLCPLNDNSGSEGIAMLEIIHDMAPGAELGFCPAFSDDGQAGLANAVTYLATTAACDVIVDDVAYLTEPYFEDGIVAQAVDAAKAAGVVYVSSAGNGAQEHYENLYVDATPGIVNDIPAPLADPHNFGAAAGEPDDTQWLGFVADDTFSPFGLNFVAGFLQWNDPFGGSDNDYDLYFFDINGLEAGNPLGAFPLGFVGVDPQVGIPGFDTPLEIALIINTNDGSPFNTDPFLIVIDRFFGDPDKVLELNFNGLFLLDPLYNVEAGSVWGHAAAQGAIATGAVDHETPTTIESFSSRGPSLIFFPDFEERNKPELVAVDGVSVTGSGGFPSEFFGTSAAAPHAAAIFALMLDADGSLTPDEIMAAIPEITIDLGDPGFDFTYGWGFIDALTGVRLALEGRGCGDPGTQPSWDGLVVEEDGMKYLPIAAPTGLTQLTFTNTQNLNVLGLFGDDFADLSSVFSRTDTESGAEFVYTGESGDEPTFVFVKVEAENDADPKARFFLVAEDACGRTVNLDPEISLDRTVAGNNPEGIPAAFALGTNYPNPFKAATTIDVALPEAAHVRVSVYDVTGREVAVLHDAPLKAGTHPVRFETQGLASGVYLYRMEAGTFVQTKRLTVLR